ncbi:Sec23/Sec24 beta-sandwich domain [Nesidiocoris tenuis]|uniref:Sec23/Sec24 beta-sandwich domain n=1 Tax=Nesidiocoris tenuis TaxID=355587 RepID=A0ABN7AM30_9HEMI|nr:Sec23/Sec24 beta-sandwich domain [Nesidiocoris tenuis]
MNGQPYNYSGSNSANGTPTPSSVSYPASLSSQSSREASPARHPPAMSHGPPEISPLALHSNSSYDQQQVRPGGMYDQHSYPIASNMIKPSLKEHSNSDLNPSRMAEMSSSALYPNSQLPVDNQSHPIYSNSDRQSFPRYENLMSPELQAEVNQSIRNSDQTNLQSRLDDTNSHGYTNSSFGLQSKNSEHNNRIVDPDWQANRLPVYGKNSMSNEDLVRATYQDHHNPSNNFHASDVQSPTKASFQQNLQGPGYSPLRQNPSVQQIQAPAPPQVGIKQMEMPPQSGPPRTNALGIIPYNTDPVTKMSQAGGGAVVNQNPLLPTASPLIQQPVKSQPYNPPISAAAPVYGSPQPVPLQKTFPPQQQPYQIQPPQFQAQQQYQPTAYSIGPPPMMQQPQPVGLQGPPLKQYSAEQHVSRPIEPYNTMPSQPQYQNHNQYQQQNNIANHSGYNNKQNYYPGPDDLANTMAGMSVNSGYNKLWGREAIDLLKSRDILPQPKVEPPKIRLAQEYFESANCSPEIFRCTLTKIPETKSLLDKSRLPLGVLIHPFKDLNQLSVIQCSVIVRCRSCRTYINPFVYFVDSKRWKCNLCFRVNDLPEEFQYDPLTKTYGDPSRRPEIKSATIEFIAPSEYMVRPPQPAAYVFVIDVSRIGAEAGYLKVFCDSLLSQLEALPGDSRTSVGFITFDSAVHFYSLAETHSQPHQMVVVDIEDMFVPCPENLLVNLNECLGLVRDLLRELPEKYRESFDTGSALGPALQAAYKLLASTGGRITIFQSCLPNCGPGKLSPREDPSQRSGENVNQTMLNPVTDFYKKLALDCSGQQIAVDLFILNSQFVDLASLSGVSKFSGGCIHHFPLFNAKNQLHVESLQRCLQRYMCRKIGFESVMRLRCTRGLSIHTFHGNFFVRSTDLLSLPNVNPDAGFGMQVSIDENLTDLQNVCFQAALLYTSSKGERRIRVHTLCLPIASNLSDVLHSADQQCIIGLLAKMAVDRCHQYSLGDAREAFVNVVADMLSAYKLTQSNYQSTSLLAPSSLSLLPLYILALLKCTAFRIGQSTRLDDRVFAMCHMKTLPLFQLIQSIYPDLYPVHNISECPQITVGDDSVPSPPTLHLTAEKIDSNGIYLMDDGSNLLIYVGHNINQRLAISMFGAPSFNSINPNMTELPELDNADSRELRNFVNFLHNEKPTAPSLQIIRDDDPKRTLFLEKLIEDKTESGHSYYEFLQRVKLLVK